MDDTHGNVTRRRVIRTGAVAAGFVWAAPAVRTVRPLQTTGSPSPTSTTGTTTTTLPAGTVVIDGSLTGFSQRGEAQAGCFTGFGLEFTISAALDDFGPAQIVLDICLIPAPQDPPLIVLAFVLTTAGGSLTGTGAGLITNPPGQPSALELQLSATDGSGAFGGALGDLRIDGEVVQATNAITGTISGTVVVSP